MPKLPVHVIRRKGSPNFYWMRDVPEYARFLFRTKNGLRKQIWKSLKTSTPKIAAVRAAEHNAWFETILSKVAGPSVQAPKITAMGADTLIIAIVDDEVRKIKNGELHDLTEEDWRRYEAGDFVYNAPENNLVKHLSNADAEAFFRFGLVENALEDSRFLVGDYDADMETLNGVIEKSRRTIHNKKNSKNPADRLAYLQAELDLEVAHQTLTKMEGRRKNLSPQQSDENLERIIDKIVSTQNKVTISEKVEEHLADPLSRKGEKDIDSNRKFKCVS